MNFKNLDSINQKILDLLTKDSRISYAEIARQTHLSRVAVRERINNLISDGIITQFTTVVQAEKVGFPLSVFLEVGVEPNKMISVAKSLVAQDKVKIVYQMTVSTALHVHAFMEDNDSLVDFLQKHVYTIDGITNVGISMLLKRFKSDLTVM